MNVKNISIREKQAIGAICIVSFSRHYKIKYGGIKQLTDHLLDLLIVDDLAEWEKAGTQLNIVGRGDDFPQELNNIIPVDLYNDFYLLIDNAVEIGIINMYGAITEEPEECLLTCLNIIEKHKIDKNVPKILFEFNHENKSWGKPWNIDNFKELKKIIYR